MGLVYRSGLAARHHEVELLVVRFNCLRFKYRAGVLAKIPSPSSQTGWAKLIKSFAFQN